MSWISDGEYQWRDLDLVRFRACEFDDEVAARVVQFTVADDRTRRQMQRSFDEHDVSLLVSFVERRSLAAWRDANHSALLEAIDALTAFPIVAPALGSWGRLALYVSRQIDVADSEIEARFSRVDRSLRHQYEVAQDALNRSEELVKVGYYQTSTSYGIGLLKVPQSHFGVQDLFGQGNLRYSVAHDLHGTFAPTVNLAEVAARLMDEVEALGWMASPLEVAPRANDWTVLVDWGSYLQPTGTLHVSFVRFADADADADAEDGGEAAPSHQEVDVWVSELPEDAEDAGSPGAEAGLGGLAEAGPVDDEAVGSVADEDEDEYGAEVDEDESEPVLIVERANLLVAIAPSPDFADDESAPDSAESPEIDLTAFSAVAERVLDATELT